MPNTYSVGEEQRKQFAGAYVLEKMINKGLAISIFLEENDQDLEPVMEFAMAKGYIEIENNEKYIATEKGREVLTRFMRRYHDYLRHYDIYCAIDLSEGTFAFADYFNFDHLESSGEGGWRKHLSLDRWEDLRVAVAEFKKLDPIEIVFMSFLNEGRFGETGEGWQFDLLLGSVWDEIVKICNSALGVSDLGYEDDEGVVAGEAVLQDVITQGAELQLELRKKEEELYDSGDDEEEDEEEFETVIIEEEETYEVYESYYDPYYVSPWWGVPVFY